MNLEPFTHHDYRDPNMRYEELVLCRRIRFGKNSNLVRFVPIASPSRNELLEYLAEIHRKFVMKSGHQTPKIVARGKHVDFSV